MLKRIETIQGVGLLHEANGKSFCCEKATLIYSDNGRGKTTLATILRSVSTGEASLINERRTIDGVCIPKISLQFEDGHRVAFDNGVWSEQRSELLVFDANFIERNVYSGNTITTGHRKNLLEFALGESSVAARAKVEKATIEAKKFTEKVQYFTAQLSGYHSNMLLAQFINLPQIDTVDIEILRLQKRIDASNSKSIILSKPVPITIKEPTFEIDNIFEKLAVSLEDIHEDAERLVKAHILKLGNTNAEKWLSEGRQFNGNESCPYCGQKSSENDLIRAYKSHFNAAYANLKIQVEQIENTIHKATAPSIIDNFFQNIQAAASLVASWDEHIQISKNYEIHLMSNDIQPETGKFYLRNKDDNLLEYTVVNPFGKLITGEITQDELKHKIPEPFSLDELKLFFTKILKITSERGHTCSIIEFDFQAAYVALESLQILLLDLVRKKQASPAESIGTEAEKLEATTLWNKIIALMQNANLSIKIATDAINTYKNKLETENIQQLGQEMLKLKMTKVRYEENVVNIIAQLNSSKSNVNAAENVKKIERNNLDKLMKDTLERYEESVNDLLDKFGASFRIRGMNANFRGSAPRSEYGLMLRGKDIALEGLAPSFATVLSEGDKRTLAFAFFIASTLEDSKLETRIVVIDDPMCSLDRHRRNHTKVVLKKIHSKANQLIIFAHDIHFLRELRDHLQKDNKTTKIASFQLTLYDTEKYTNFSSIDVDRECESSYFQSHRLVNDYIKGQPIDKKSVAQAIRPMLEGYLCRRFPGKLRKGLMFGEIMVLIRDAVAPDPLHYAKNLLDELNEINDYAGQFHHDTNPQADTTNIESVELAKYVERALNVIHKSCKC